MLGRAFLRVAGASRGGRTRLGRAGGKTARAAQGGLNPPYTQGLTQGAVRAP